MTDNLTQKQCLRAYMLEVEAAFRQQQQQNPNPNQPNPVFYWERRKTAPAEPEPTYEESAGWLYGFNKTKFPFPVSRDPVLCDRLKNENPVDNLPEQMIPPFDPNILCSKHQHTYDPSDANLIKVQDRIKIYYADEERVVQIPVFARHPYIHCHGILVKGKTCSILHTSA